MAGMFRLSVIAVAALLLTGCFSAYQPDRSTRSSLMEFLYPDRDRYIESPATPHLRLPLRVGVAFTPATRGGAGQFSEVDRMALASDVAGHFERLDYVSSLQIIPGQYLRDGGSFDNLEQLQGMFGIDVTVLLSYDQRVFTDEGLATLSYWTIVGAYTVPGEKNDTHTLLDAAVYDIASRKMLFRAPGTSTVKSRATLVANPEQLRHDSVQGFQTAGQQLTDNLAVALEAFTERLKDAPEEIQVSRRPGYIGSGSTDLAFLGLLAVLSTTVLARRWRDAVVHDE